MHLICWSLHRISDLKCPSATVINSEAWSASFLVLQVALCFPLNVAHMTFCKLESQGFFLLMLKGCKCASPARSVHRNFKVHEYSALGTRGGYAGPWGGVLRSRALFPWEPEFKVRHHGAWRNRWEWGSVAGSYMGTGRSVLCVAQGTEITVKVIRLWRYTSHCKQRSLGLISSDQIRDVTSRKQKKHQPRLF